MSIKCVYGAFFIVLLNSYINSVATQSFDFSTFNETSFDTIEVIGGVLIPDQMDKVKPFLKKAKDLYKHKDAIKTGAKAVWDFAKVSGIQLGLVAGQYIIAYGLISEATSLRDKVIVRKQQRIREKLNLFLNKARKLHCDGHYSKCDRKQARQIMFEAQMDLWHVMEDLKDDIEYMKRVTLAGAGVTAAGAFITLYFAHWAWAAKNVYYAVYGGLFASGTAATGYGTLQCGYTYMELLTMYASIEAKYEQNVIEFKLDKYKDEENSFNAILRGEL